MRALSLTLAVGLSALLSGCGSDSAQASAASDPGPRENRSFTGTGFTG
jgi:uncharacterized protein YceK